MRTASASISRSSALVFAGSRGVGFHVVIATMWGCRRGIKPSTYGMSPCLLPGGLFRKGLAVAGGRFILVDVSLLTEANKFSSILARASLHLLNSWRRAAAISESTTADAACRGTPLIRGRSRHRPFRPEATAGAAALCCARDAKEANQAAIVWRPDYFAALHMVAENRCRAVSAAGTKLTCHPVQCMSADEGGTDSAQTSL